MSTLWVLGEALMDCLAEPDGRLRPLMGGSPYNMARAAARAGAQVGYLNPLSSDRFGQQLAGQLLSDGVQLSGLQSPCPTSLAVVQLHEGQPSYGFYREGIADRDYQVETVLALLRERPPGILHTGSLLLVPPEHHKVLALLQAARDLGWTLSLDVNLRPALARDLAEYVAAVRQVMRLADWIKASDEDLHTLGFGEVRPDHVRAIAAEVAALGASRVAVTLGASGAWLQIDGQGAWQDARTVKVVDTVGAGDTFWGQVVADWQRAPEGAAGRLAETLRVACAAAAINCTRAGCEPPSREEALAF